MDFNTINSIDIIGGYDKSLSLEKIKALQFKKGNIYAIVGETGSGKSQLLEDIQSLNQGEGVTKRHININGCEPSNSLFNKRRSSLIAHLSQNMRFALDMTVIDFLKKRSNIHDEILTVANTLTGESIMPSDILTKLSGGQSRALMIADVAFNSFAPVILIDEIENAGIKKLKALDLLVKQNKIILMITHDPLLSLYASQRIIMKNGGIDKIIDRSIIEDGILENLTILETQIDEYRNAIRCGKSLLYNSERSA